MWGTEGPGDGATVWGDASSLPFAGCSPPTLGGARGHGCSELLTVSADSCTRGPGHSMGTHQPCPRTALPGSAGTPTLTA